MVEPAGLKQCPATGYAGRKPPVQQHRNSTHYEQQLQSKDKRNAYVSLLTSSYQADSHFTLKSDEEGFVKFYPSLRFKE